MHFATIMRTILLVLLAVATVPVTAADLPHQKQPFENLTVAGQPSLPQLESLAGDGFTTIINLRPVGEFDDFDEAAEVSKLGLEYVHIPVANVRSITPADARALHEALSASQGPVLLHCTVGWRAGGLLAIERYLLHGVSEEEALEIAARAHMSHATGDVASWIEKNSQRPTNSQ